MSDGPFYTPPQLCTPKPIPLKGKNASSGQSMEGPEADTQLCVATAGTEEDTSPKVLIRAEWRKVPNLPQICIQLARA